MIEQVDDNQTERFRLRLLVVHPCSDLAFLPALLGIAPQHIHFKGMPRATPAGRSLPGVYPDSRWSHSFELHSKRLFSEEIGRLLDSLNPHAAVFQEIALAGGFTDIIVNVDGGVNIGDTLDWRILERFVELRINLGFEAFPKFS